MFVDKLADMTSANQYLVRKKIIIGIAITSLTLNLCTSQIDKAKDKNKGVSIGEKYTTSNIVPSTGKTPETKKDTIKNKAKKKVTAQTVKPKFLEPIITCYDESVETIEIPEPDSIKDILATAEQMPVFKGGTDSLLKFINRNLKYPDDMGEIDVSGHVILQFIVTEKGEIVSPKVVRSLYPSLDKEAIRVVQLMPKWVPGKQNGKEVNVKFFLPINFKKPE